MLAIVAQEGVDDAPAGFERLIDLATSVPGMIIAVLSLATAYLAFKTQQLAHKKEAGVDEATVNDGVPSRTRTLERVLQTRILRVGVIVADPWFMYEGSSASPSGIYPAILSDIADRNDLTVVYTPISNHVIFDRLNSDEIDFAAQLLQTVERAEKGHYAALIHNVKLVAIVRKGQTRIRSQADIGRKDIRCAVVRGEIGSEIAKRQYGKSDESDTLIVLNTRYVPAVFYLVRDNIDVAITTGARWIELNKKDPEYAEQLEMLGGEALQLLPAGSLIKQGESDFVEWLEKETELSRTMPEVRAMEDAYISQFSDAVVRA